MSHALLTFGVVIAALATPTVHGVKRPQATQEKLVGTWVGKVRIDADGLKQNPLVGTDLSEEKIKGVALAFQLLAATKQQTLTFAQDGTAINILSRGKQRQEKKGTWKILKSEGDRLTVQLTHAEDKQVLRLSFRLLSDNEMELETPGTFGKGIVHRFTRQKPPAK